MFSHRNYKYQVVSCFLVASPQTLNDCQNCIGKNVKSEFSISFISFSAYAVLLALRSCFQVRSVSSQNQIITAQTSHTPLTHATLLAFSNLKGTSGELQCLSSRFKEIAFIRLPLVAAVLIHTNCSFSSNKLATIIFDLNMHT